MSLSLNRLLNSRSGFPWKRLFGHFFSSTAAHTRSFSLYRRMSPLYWRISPLGDSKISMVPVLDEWVQKGRTVNEEELRDIIQKLNHYRRFKHALEYTKNLKTCGMWLAAQFGCGVVNVASWPD
ncbi:hypothetical protein CK203_025836 [Vitis vinifera]|uniref:Pentatricopeptide repeat-containing protein, mitochondrial n=1 Tax=Vitis vinifera TaxID=29760 RepID=A0A438DQY5_VITVI|nr:hypothetical protein CK203_094206 [Vitis vinifera]RVW95853.1 hypothetical protein CK203_025836 [Vitis vinifera]